MVSGLDFGTMDIPGALKHVKFRDFKVGRLVDGCHDAVEFAKVRQVNAIGNTNYQVAIGKTLDEVEEIVIVGTRNSTTPGVKIIEYKIPALDIRSKTTGFLKGDGSVPFQKTTYNPAIWPDIELEKALKEALQDAANKNNGILPLGNPSPGFTSEGYKVMFTTSNGNVTSLWFE
jgi:hypothetical protein